MERKDLVVYVAGPISKGDLAENVRRAHDAGLRLLKAGLSPIVPHGSCFWGNRTAAPASLANAIVWRPEVLPVGTTHEDWYGADLAIVRRCDAVLRLPGESAGADMECREAMAHGIPAFTDEAELFRWLRERE